MNEVCLIFRHDFWNVVKLVANKYHYNFKWWKLMLFPGLCCLGEWYQLIQSNESSAVLKNG